MERGISRIFFAHYSQKLLQPPFLISPTSLTMFNSLNVLSNSIQSLRRSSKLLLFQCFSIRNKFFISLFQFFNLHFQLKSQLILLMMNLFKKLVGFSSLLAGYYYVSQYKKISLQNEYLSSLLTATQKHKPEYSIALFKFLLQLRLLQKNPKLGQYVLKDFDTTGSYIQQICDLGFKGTEVGPVALNPPAPDQSNYNLGIKHCLSYICSYRAKNHPSKFQIYLKIVPNYQVLQFTPYLVKENVVQALTIFADIQKLSQNAIVNGVVVEFAANGLGLQPRVQTQKLKGQTKSQCVSVLERANQGLEKKISLSVEERHYKSMSWNELLDQIKTHNFEI